MKNKKTLLAILSTSLIALTPLLGIGISANKEDKTSSSSTIQYQEEINKTAQGDLLFETYTNLSKPKIMIELYDGNIMIINESDDEGMDNFYRTSAIILDQEGSIVKDKFEIFDQENDFSVNNYLILDDGNIFLFGNDIYGQNDLNAAVIDQQGNIVKSSFYIGGEYSYWNTAVLLNNGHIMLIGMQSGGSAYGGSITILDQEFNVVVEQFYLFFDEEGVFYNSFWFNSIKLNNGNVLISSFDSVYAILDQDGNIVKSPYKIKELEKLSVYTMSVFSNGNILIGGRWENPILNSKHISEISKENSEPELALIDQNGNLIKFINIENFDLTWDILASSSILKDSDNALIFGTHKILIDNNGNILSQERLFSQNEEEPYSIEWQPCITMINGNVLMAHWYDPNSFGTLMIFDGREGTKSEINDINIYNITESSVQIDGSFLYNDGFGNLNLTLYDTKDNNIVYKEDKVLENNQIVNWNINDLQEGREYRVEINLDYQLVYSNNFRTLLNSEVLFDFNDISVSSDHNSLTIDYLGHTFRYAELYIRKGNGEQYVFHSVLNSNNSSQTIELTSLDTKTIYYVAVAGVGLNGTADTTPFTSNEYMFQTSTTKPDVNISINQIDIEDTFALIRVQNNSFDQYSNFFNANLEYRALGSQEWIISSEVPNNVKLQYILLEGLSSNTNYEVRISGTYLGNMNSRLSFKSNVISFKTN